MPDELDADQKKALALFEAAGHKPELDNDGVPDWLAYDDDENGHNGFCCTECYYAMCIYCVLHDGVEVEPCICRSA